jgi:hypothetical protein
LKRPNTALQCADKAAFPQIRLRDWVPKDSCYATAPSMRAFRGFDKRSDLVGVRQRLDRRARSGQSGLLSKAGLILVPLPDRNYEK